jgi:4a-hydroxytetrahydrobiopterin dehydratase
MSRLLEPEEIARQLVDLPGWSSDGQALSRTVEAPDFMTAIAVVDEVAVAAEAMNHHPDIDIRWRRLGFTLATHSAGGVTQLDVELAHQIDAIARARGTS